MDEDSPCDVCGSLFNDDLIETCSTCNIREHRYCMVEVCRTVPDDWECNSCKKAKEKISRESGKMEDRVASTAGSVHHDVKHPARSSKVLNDSRWQAHSKRQKPVEAGKVKFLPNEEAIRLASGVQTMGSPRNFNSKHSISNFMAPMPPRTPVKPTTGTPKSPLSKENPSIIPSGTEKSPRHGTPVKMRSISKLIQQTSPVQKDPIDGKTHAAEHYHADGEELRDAEPKASLAQNSKRHGSRASLVTEISLAKEVRPSKIVVQNGEDAHAEGKTRAAEDNHDGKEVLKRFMSLNLNHSSLPAPDATWKGGFILDTDTPHFIGGFQAQSSYNFRDFHPKVYAFSQKMPLVLKANLISRSHLWSDVFQDERPDLRDVALYFFPSDNIESSRENKVLLIELMDKQDSMMRICFDGEEMDLLIFTSRVLQLDSQLISFLWGIFRSTKKVEDHQANMVDSDSVDMDIDMLGGESVGRVDIVVRRDHEVTSNTETSSGLKTTILKENSGKEVGEISGKELEDPPGFCKGSTVKLPSGLNTTSGLQPKLVKEEGEISTETKKELEGPPGFCEGSKFKLSSGLNTSRSLQSKLVKEEVEISIETEKQLEGPPGFCKGSTQSATGPNLVYRM